MIFPEGTTLSISTENKEGEKKPIAGFHDLGGDIGFDGLLNSSQVLSDVTKQYGKSKRQDGGERDMSGRYEIGDEGQIELKKAASDGKQRSLELTLPADENGVVTKWEFEAVFASWKLAKPEETNAMMWVVKAGLNVDGGITNVEPNAESEGA